MFDWDFTEFTFKTFDVCQVFTCSRVVCTIIKCAMTRHTKTFL